MVAALKEAKFHSGKGIHGGVCPIGGSGSQVVIFFDKDDRFWSIGVEKLRPR